MEKKNKFLQSSSKGTAGDSKKNQEVVNSKLFPKTSRKREPTNASNFSKYDPPRKYNVQKAKSFDKRPKPKGQYHGGSKEDTKVVEEDFAELGSVMVPGCKKQNLNHLLNFYYEPRDVQSGSSTWNNGKLGKGYSRNSNRWLPPIQRHKYNKEQFLQASCQFVVTANADYSLYLTDPDVLVDWKLIEQIKVHSSEKLSCPICLCTPVAGKMTRCGHVYCWPCILHYLSLSDKTWRKCPICYESIHKSDLKSVVEVTETAFNLGDTITLCLMRREKGSLLATPVLEPLMPSPTTFLSVSDNINNQVYSKLLLAHKNDVMNIIEHERIQLNIELMDYPDSPENCYIEEALNELLKREELLQKKEKKNDMKNKISSTDDSVVGEGKEEQVHEQEIQQTPQTKLESSAKSHNSSCKDDTSVTEDQARYVAGAAVNDQYPGSSQKFFYFYQAQDGQHVYLHAMNVKMLEMQYGSLENSPHVITGKLLEKENGSFTEDLRRRLRYLCHLPLTCQFEVAEIELKPPVVSDEVLHCFHDQLELRERCRQRREREEKRREKKITEEENKRMGRYPSPNVRIESRRHFPQWQPELFTEDAIVSSPTESVASSVASSPSLSAFDELASNIRETGGGAGGSTAHEQGPSFAEMLRNTGTRFKSGSAWPSVNSVPSRSLQSAVGTAHSSSRDLDNDEQYTPVPSYSQSFGDVLAQALENTKLLDSDSKADADVTGGKKKKKKNKPTVLFTTGMARAS